MNWGSLADWAAAFGAWAAACATGYFSWHLVRIEKQRDERDRYQVTKLAVKNMLRNQGGRGDFQRIAKTAIQIYRLTEDLFYEALEELREENPFFGYPDRIECYGLLEDYGVKFHK